MTRHGTALLLAGIAILGQAWPAAADAPDSKAALTKALGALESQESDARDRLQALEKESAAATMPDARRALRTKRLAIQRDLDQVSRIRNLWRREGEKDLDMASLSEEAAAAALKQLDSLRAEIVSASSLDDRGRTPLHAAAADGDEARAKRLLEIGIPADVADDGGLQPLHLAVWRGTVPVAKILLDAGAPREAKSYKAPEKKPVAAAVGKSPLSGVTPLHIAAYTGSIPLATLLLERGADLKAEGDFCDGVG